MDRELSLLHFKPNQVNLMINLPPVYTQHLFTTHLKWRSGPLRTKYPWVKSRVASLWNRYYFCSLVGAVDYDQLEQFRLAQQRKDETARIAH